MDYQLIGAIAAIVTILGGIFAAFKWGRRFLVRLWHFVSRYKPKVPRESIRVLPQMHGCWWSNGSVSGKPAMQVVGRWHVTNITGDNIRVLAARTSKPKTTGHVLTRHPNDNVFGSYPILPGETTEVSSDFWIVPPVRKEGEDFKTAVILVDQYGNEHKIKNVVFKGPKLKEPKKDEPPSESIHSIADPIEKEIVAVLKAEVNRYKACGRRVGGLGSIQTTIQGKSYKGVGTEWREADSPKNQAIIEDESTIEISSDNAQALINLYGKLESDDEKDTYFRVLFDRLNRNTEYAPIGYLILYVSFQINKLETALNDAVENLQGDEAYGFSDLLRLLDSLLRFRHSSFSQENLDLIESALGGVQEHTFRIEERLAAIRAYRLSRAE
jgi:hypothetical protein